MGTKTKIEWTEATSEHAGIVLYHGDCREVLAGLPENSVDSVVCDPPYDLTANKKGGTGEASVNLNSPFGRARITTGFMGKKWDGTGVAFDPETWKAVLRVMKPGAHLVAFGGSRTYHRLACAIEDAGFEIRDQIQWIYGSGFPKSLDVSKAIDAHLGAEREVIGMRRVIPGVAFEQSSPYATGKTMIPATAPATAYDGWGTALKPAHEPIVLARKPFGCTVAENVLTYGTGGLNIDACRIGYVHQEDKAAAAAAARRSCQDETGNGKGIASFQHSTQTRGIESLPEFYENQEKGRWPANVIHDGSDEVLAHFPDAPGALRPVNGSEKPKTGTAVYGDYGPRPSCEPRDDFGSAARFFYCAKASKEDREEGLDDLPIRSAGEVTERQEGTAGLNSPRAGAGRTNGSRNHHPTVKPVELMRYLVRLVTPLGGVCLDPFAGSGSTGKACAMEDVRAILIEKEIEYCELAARRVRLSQPRLFGAVANA